ncbi:MAG: hypothetical protein WDM70_10200 [Nitrosomonadales bacterium]
MPTDFQSPAQTKQNSSIPFNFPEWALNPLSIAAFNALYFNERGKSNNRFSATMILSFIRWMQLATGIVCMANPASCNTSA